ncbi:hypothetical protein BD309DRAFT_356001 [Dichomitus squalens]|nr:hypothetical protein BD309DRAFT_356001 [Dichomitus squalens]
MEEDYVFYPSRARHWLRRRRYRVACCMGGAYGSRTYRGIERRVVARTLDRLPGPGPAATGRNVLDERSPVSSCSTKATQKVGIMSENYEGRRRRRQVWEISLRQAQARSSMDPTSTMSVPSQSTSVKPDVARGLWSIRGQRYRSQNRGSTPRRNTVHHCLSYPCRRSSPTIG